MAADSSTSTRVAYLGMGIMGRGMAANLLRAGFVVTVWNRSAGRSDVLAALGARVAPDIATAVRDADVVCLCVTGPEDVAAVVMGPGGVLESSRPGQIVIDHSTITPDMARQVAAAAALRGVSALDAPVTGGETGAREGTLTIICGGDRETFDHSLPVLEAMGRKVVLVGGPGAGQTLKLIGNLIGGITMAATIEGLALGIRAGLNLEQMIEVLKASSANSAFLEASGDRILSGHDVPGFSVANRIKDLRLAVETAEGLDHHLPLGVLTHALFSELGPDHLDLDQIAFVRRHGDLFPRP